MSAKGEVSETRNVVAIPATLTDFATALRELISAFRDAVGLIDSGKNLLAVHRAEKTADGLDYISFKSGNFLTHLDNIAKGHCTEEDFDSLRRLLGATAEGVQTKILALRKSGESVRKTCGASASHKLDQLLDGPYGKFVIRYEIEGLVQMHEDGKHGEAVQLQARNIIGKIDEFNRELIALHDTVFPPKRIER
ncbi:MAG: hypothetical protein N4A65_01225 [Cohaesibacter sp.]|jgi:hypothetical protein|nr:hypothetical protein [Cohaesibacter sp.]